MEIQFFYAYFASEDTLKDGMKAMLRHNREDLARDLVYEHAGIESQGRHPKLGGPTEDNVKSTSPSSGTKWKERDRHANERSNVRFPLWRKKMDGSMFGISVP